MSLACWQKLGESLFGPDVDQWRFICPSCGHIQTRADWRKLGMNHRLIDMLLGFSCIGRWLNPLRAVEFGELSEGYGCMYHGHQRRNISPTVVIISPGEERPTFGFAKH